MHVWPDFLGEQESVVEISEIVLAACWSLLLANRVFWVSMLFAGTFFLGEETIVCIKKIQKANRYSHMLHVWYIYLHFGDF